MALESSPNPEDMRIFIITKMGRVIIYQLNIDRQIDESHLMDTSADESNDGENESAGNQTLEEVNENTDSPQNATD